MKRNNRLSSSDQKPPIPRDFQGPEENDFSLTRTLDGHSWGVGENAANRHYPNYEYLFDIY